MTTNAAGYVIDPIQTSSSGGGGAITGPLGESTAASAAVATVNVGYAGTITQTTKTLVAATSAQLIAANANRKGLRWMVTGANPMTVVPGAGPAAVNTGLNYSGNSGAGTQGGSDTFEGSSCPTGAFQAISTGGTTVIIWETT